MAVPPGRREVGEQVSLGIPDSIPVTDEARNIGNVLGLISGSKIERQLIDLAAIGGTPLDAITEQPERYATNRLALTESDEEARQTFIRPLMEKAGLEIIEHPFGIIGVRHGKDPNLEPIVVISHIDTVPDGDMFDGTLGSVGGIAIAQAIEDAGLQLDRDLMFIPLTCEESSRFNFPCVGSESMFQGLDGNKLSALDTDGNTIASVIGSESVQVVSQPWFGPLGDRFPKPHAVLELHVSQDKRLEDQGFDLAVVNAIAAPIRYEVKFGTEEPIRPAETDLPYSRYFDFIAQGRADHSGATPMTPGARHDGLLETSNFLTDVLRSKEFKDSIALADIDIDGQAINKIPGIARTSFRISGKSQEEVDRILNGLLEKVKGYNEQQAKGEPARNIYAIEETPLPDDKVFFNQEEAIGRQLMALSFIRAVNVIASDPKLSKDNIVGTVGTFKTDKNGIISLGLDIRGTNKDSRDAVITKLINTFDLLQVFSSVDFGEPLAGSGDPVELDAGLAERAEKVIKKYEIGTSTTMFSAAGHDTQNAARAGIPAVMIFVPSRDGIAHNPKAYTSPEHIEKGVRTLAALVLELAAK